MLVTADYSHGMLARESGNPNVIGRDGAPASLEFAAENCILAGGSVIDVQNPAVRNQLPQPFLIPGAISRLRDPVSILSQHNNWESQLAGSCEDGFEQRVAIGHRREAVRV